MGGELQDGVAHRETPAALSGTEPVRPELLRQFIVNALILHTVFKFNSGLPNLLAALRYEMQPETSPEFRNIPLITVVSCLQTFRPSDELISTATAFSGVPAFVELLDLEGSQSPRDLLKETIEQLTQ